MAKEGKLSFVQLSTEQQKELEQFAQAPGWRILGRKQLPRAFPESLREKLDSAVLAVSSSTGSVTTILMMNAHRVDPKDQAVDHEPLVVIVTPSGASSTAMLVHHGTWDGRTIYPPRDFWDHVSASGIGDYFLSKPPDGVTGGDLSTLPTGHRKAFEAAIQILQRNWKP